MFRVIDCQVSYESMYATPSWEILPIQYHGWFTFYARLNKMKELKVSKFQKQIILSSHSPKNQRNFSHFSALASKKSWKIVQTQDESTKILIWCYLTQWNSFIALIRPLLKARAKNVKIFVGFLGNEKTRLFAFEIYWPLAGLTFCQAWWRTNNQRNWL